MFKKPTTSAKGQLSSSTSEEESADRVETSVKGGFVTVGVEG